MLEGHESDAGMRDGRRRRTTTWPASRLRSAGRGVAPSSRVRRHAQARHGTPKRAAVKEFGEAVLGADAYVGNVARQYGNQLPANEKQEEVDCRPTRAPWPGAARYARTPPGSEPHRYDALGARDRTRRRPVHAGQGVSSSVPRPAFESRGPDARSQGPVRERGQRRRPPYQHPMCGPSDVTMKRLA